MTSITYADRLDRMVLGEWVVVDRAPLAVDHTGSHFSVGYVVESGASGQRAFLKALSFDRIIREAGPENAMAALQEALNLYNFEVRVCQRCQGLDRVVTMLDFGSVQVDPSQPLSLVPYLIFEQAEGDVRAFIEFSADLDAAWALRCMHHIALGLRQMHSREIAHQDVKPSNVLLFGRQSSKLGDVGRAVDRTVEGPYDESFCAGAVLYAPPELLYHQLSQDWQERRLASDLYLLGSMLVFFFAQTTMTALLLQRLPNEARPRDGAGNGWGGDYAGVLPIVQRAFAIALDDFAAATPADLRMNLRDLLQQLCDPDPRRRGDPKARRVKHGSPYDLQSYISRFNAMAGRIEARVGLPHNLSGSKVAK